MFTSTTQSIAKKAILAGAVAAAFLSCPLQAHASTVVHVNLKGETVAMRLYNPYTGEHLFSENGHEVQNLSANGWNFEQFAWKGEGDAHVYRLYSPWGRGGDHHYTIDKTEVEKCIQSGWSLDEGATLTVSSTQKEGYLPVYRLYNPYEQDHYHHFTTDRNEANARIADGWRDEGVAWYVAPVEMVEKDGTLSPKGASDTTSTNGAGIYNLTTAANTNNESANAGATEGETSALSPTTTPAEGSEGSVATTPEATNDTTPTTTPSKRWVVDKPAWTETKYTHITKYMNGHIVSVSTTDPNDLVHIEDTKLMQAWREGKFPSIKTEEEARKEFWTTKLAERGEALNCKYQKEHEFKPGEAGNWTELPLKTEIIEHPAEGHWE